MIGQIVSHYKVLEKLGEGGMGEVYKCEDTKLNRTVALKFLRTGIPEDVEQGSRFKREAQAAAALDHPNICAVYEIDAAQGQTFIAMAYVDGVDLGAKIRSGPLPLDRVIEIAIQIAEGIAAAHKRGIVHRDIKCSNIMITRDGRVKILDFGLADIQGEGAAASSALISGTVAYMSPEQVRGDDVDHRTDIWSFGVCLFEMLAGRPPFEGEYEQAIIYSILNQNPTPLTALRPDLPPGIVAIVEKALEKNLDYRYQDISEVMEELKNPDEVLATRRPGKRPSIAVLPFADMSPQKDQGYFCDGMAEEIINALSNVEGMDVVARTSSFSFKGRNESVSEIGRKLGVNALLEGSVRKSGDQLRITAQIINVADSYHVWSGQYDRDLKDIFAIQDEIAQNIVKVFEVELSEPEKRAMEKTPTGDVHAYDLYLRGRSYFYQSKRKSINYAIETFSRATEKDPGYALAYAGMADCYSYLYMYFDRSEENLAKALEASKKALELDPELAEAHAAYGFAVSLHKQYDEAEKEFEIAIELNPRLFEAYYYYARTCFARGNPEKAAGYYEKACMVDPENHQAPNLLAFTYRSMNLLSKSIATYRFALRNIDRRLEMHPDDSRAMYLKSSTLIELGRNEEGLRWADRAYEADPIDPYIIYGVACSYSRLGRIEEAVDYFEKSVKCGFAHKDWIDNDVDLDAIREHPRFKAIMSTLE